MCAVMVLIAAAPLALGGSHYVPKGDQGPRANAVTWEYVPASYGNWTGHITNDGLRSIMVEVYDITTGTPDQISHKRIRFAAYGAYPTGVVDTEGVAMAPSHKYSITVTPSGPKGSSCTVDDVFGPPPPTVVAVITVVSMNYLTVVVDGSLSYCPDGTIASYDWDFGDGLIATGVTATHTYAMKGTYTITLTVTIIGGFTGTDSKVFTVVEPPPLTASFTVTASGLTVNVDASASTGYGALSYTWDWGDGTTGSGIVATHTYAASVNSTPSKPYTGPPYYPHTIFGFIYAADGVTLLPGCEVTLVNLRTGYSLNGFSEFDDGYYQAEANVFELGYYPGDLIRVTATSGAHTGWTTAPLTWNAYDQIDVSMGTGVVTTTLRITDTLGQTASVSETVTLIEPPLLASFTYTVDGLTVNVDASSSSSANEIVSYAWDWGDGTTGTGITATHTYSTATSVLADSGYTLSGRGKTVPHAIYGFTYAADGVTALPGCTVFITNMRTGESIVYDSTREFWDPTSNVYSVDLSEFRLIVPPAYTSWVFGDLLNVTAVKGTAFGWTVAPITDNPYGHDQIDVVLAGVFGPILKTVTLTVTDAIGRTDSVSQTVTLFTPPMAFFTYTVSGLMVNVNASASIGNGIVSYDWDWGDGTTGTGMTAAHLYAVAGTYKTTLTVTDNKGLSGSASIWITAPPPPPGPP